MTWWKKNFTPDWTDKLAFFWLWFYFWWNWLYIREPKGPRFVYEKTQGVSVFIIVISTYNWIYECNILFSHLFTIDWSKCGFDFVQYRNEWMDLLKARLRQQQQQKMLDRKKWKEYHFFLLWFYHWIHDKTGKNK